MRVLLVDDAMFMRRILSDQLLKAGFEIVGEASNGYQAVKQYEKLRPDLVFMDITLPEENGVKSGIDAVRLIRAKDANARIIMCSAMGQQPMIMEAIQAGAKDFIVKPFKANELSEKVKRINVA